MNVALVLQMVADGMPERRGFGELTYADLAAAAARVPARVGRAERVVLVGATSPLVPVAFFGAAWAGASYAPVNYRLPPAAQTELLERLQPAVVAEESWLPHPAAAGDPPPNPFPDEPGTPAVVLFTSGTSAAPKAAVLGHQHLLAYVLNTVEFASAGEDEAVLLAVPPFHVAGVAAVLSSTYAGRRIVPLAQFSAHGWLRRAREEAVTHAFVVPTMLARIVEAMEADPDTRVPSLRSLVYGGAAMPAPVLERALGLFPDAGFVNAYGLTETASTVTVLGPQEHRAALASADPAQRRRLGSVGRPVPGVEAQVVDGELWLRGDQVAGSYLGAGSLVDADGWLHTGDRGDIDDQGYLFVLGRVDEMIIRGGENVSPAEVEDALQRHPDVTGAAVVGLPDVEWGERIGAMVSLAAGATATPEQLRAWAQAELGSLKAPEVLVVVEELPVTATGKLLRRDVRARLGGSGP